MKFLFILNAGSGSGKTDWVAIIQDYFRGKEHQIEIFQLPSDCPSEMIKSKINEFNPDRVVAVGGDGTVKLVASCLLNSDMVLALLPAGSANGMAKEFKIPLDPKKAVDAAVNGRTEEISLIEVNGHHCIHLSDIGFNAFLVNQFEMGDTRGFWGYLKASLSVIWRNPVMQLEIKTEGKSIRRSAAMVVLANATRYGTGVKVNPEGKLNDDFFELIIIKKISFTEIWKMKFSHKPYDPAKTEVLKIQSLHIQSVRKVHFQVDGEYLGKVLDVRASIHPRILKVMVSQDPIESL